MNMCVVDSFADVKILRYSVDGFEQLTPKQKFLLYYLSEAALWGREILFHQNGGDETILLLRTLDAIYAYQQQKGELDSRLALYTKRVWFCSGVHHHYSNDKFLPEFSQDDFNSWLAQVLNFDTWVGVSAGYAASRLSKLIFDKDYKPKKVCLDNGVDLVASSAVNFYEGVSQREVEHFYKTRGANALNSKLILNANNQLEEQIWKVGGMYSDAIVRIVENLKRASQYAENEQQVDIINTLIAYYEQGDLSLFDEYNKKWVAEKQSIVDFINGFIEVYSDPLGFKGTWESIVELVDAASSERIRLISENAQWFEDHSPIDAEFRKTQVTGVSMRVVNAVMLAGDCYPATPIGVNLPNAEWIREQFGSKSISLGNITHAHHEAAKSSGVLDEFAYDADEISRARTWGRLADDLHTQLHECLGHGSGRMREGVTLDALKAYGSTLEEARADLFALYFMADPKMIELGIIPSLDVAWSHYDAYLRSGMLVQLARIAEGKNVEESHMRNRLLISRYVFEKGSATGAVKMLIRDGKHYIKIYGYQSLRQMFGELLREIQRIKSTGDYEAARALVENYGIRIDAMLHHEVRERYQKLGIKPFSGFVNPRMSISDDGRDIHIDYTEAYDAQMLRYGNEYKTLKCQ